ncbi:hypothetical protein [Streptomyces sp. NBC_00271]|uniref:hypothetical protein n=1 Tax=Streptomyces sp. NBC_00271 TaxID=2975697 RepID=UPI002E2A9A7F|nr:hypothetical protein [Streptomyces sp. NBC_00271]
MSGYDEFSNLTEDVTVVSKDTELELDESAAVTMWTDGLNAEGATVLAGCDHPHFGQWAAVTTIQAGEGRTTYAGTLPNLPVYGAAEGVGLRGHERIGERPCAQPSWREPQGHGQHGAALLTSA